jgi:hypothetical protein
VLTYSAFVQRHFTSRLEQLPADAVELLKQVCYTNISLDSSEYFKGEPTAQAGTAVRFWARLVASSTAAKNQGLMSKARNCQALDKLLNFCRSK